MTDETIIIGIRGEVEGGRIVKRTLDDIANAEARAQKGAQGVESQFRATDGAARFLLRTLQTLGAAFGLRQLQQTVDTYTNIQNRLKLVTNGTGELAAVTEELFRISNSTRNAFESTAEVYARVALATKDLGLSQRDTLQFTESLNQAVILSGASSAEAAAGLMQLSQGLASGTLRGDELRSVLEQLPAVADVIAKGLGVTRGELRKMGEDGKITADIVIDAFQKAQKELADNFGKTVPTIAQSFTVLQNKVVEFVGELDAATGASAEISKAILTIGKNIDVLAAFIITAAGAWLIYKTAVLSATLTMNGLILALTGPGAIIAALAAVGAAAYVFRDDLQRAVIDTLNVIIETTNVLIETLRALGFEFKNIDQISQPSILSKNDQRSVFDLVNEPDPYGLGRSPEMQGRRRNRAPSQEAIESAKKTQKELNDLIKQTSTEQEILLQKLADLEKLKPYADTKEELEAINRAQQIYNEELKTASDSIIPGFENGMDRLIRQTDKFAEAVADAFSDFVSGAKSGREALGDLLGALQSLVLQETVTGPFSDMLRGVLRGGFGGFGGGGGNSIGGGIAAGLGGGGGFFGGLRSFFGFDSGGSMTLGGNSGIDQNILSLNGAPIAKTGRGEVLSISPTQSGGGGTVVVNQSFNMSLGVQAAVAAEFATMLPKIQESTIAAVKESSLRGI